jgi:hypothetical protein
MLSSECETPSFTPIQNKGPNCSSIFYVFIFFDSRNEDRRSSRISRKERIKNVTIRQQIGLEETIVKQTEQNQLTWYGHVQRMVEGRLPKQH